MSDIRTISRENDLMVRAIYGATRLISRYFDVRLFGVDNIPSKGGVMLVGNHALMGIDAWALIPELVHTTGRVPRGMTLRSLFKIPLVSHSLRRVGMVKGERGTAVELLEHGEVVLTYPGGVKDSLRGKSEQYQLEWAGRCGFAHASIRAQAPIIPIVGVGPDECFKILNDQGILPTRGLGHKSIRAPLFVPIIKRVPFDFHIGQPILPPKENSPEAAKEFALHVQQVTQELLDLGVEAREDNLASRRTSV